MKPIPTIEQLYSRIESNFRNRLNLTDDDLRKVLDAFSATISGELKLIYLFLSDIQNNLYPDTADTAENGGELNRMGNIYLNRQPRPATDGYYMLKVNGIAGSQIRAGLTFKSNDDSLNPGKLFITDPAYELTGNNDIIEIRSLESGLSSALAVGNQLTITEPVSGVDQTVIIDSIVSLPIEKESEEVYRKAIIDAIQLEPQGGAKTDYRLWASDVQGVRNVYPYVKENEAGVVQVFVEATRVDSIDGNGTPSEFLLNDVEEAIQFDPDETIDINERGRRPIQAILEVLPITLIPVDVQIVSLNQNTQDVRNAIRNSMDNYLQTIRPFISGADLARNKSDILNIARLQGIAQDSLTNTNYFLDFKMFVDGNETNISTFSFSNIPFLRNVTYV